MDERRLNDIENRLRMLEQSDSRYRGSIAQGVTNDQVANAIQDTLWNHVSYTSSFATGFVTSTSPSTTETLSTAMRESDTSYGRRFKPDRESRFRGTFYIDEGLTVSTSYITSPAVSNVTTSPTTLAAATDKSYVGVKIVNGAISLVSAIAGAETVVPTTATITDDTTHLLQIDYHISHATVSFNDQIIGDIPCNLQTITLATFFPFLMSIKSSDGTTSTLNMEAYEFIQRRR